MMTEKEWRQHISRLRGELNAINKEFAKNHKFNHLVGKKVDVTYRFRGKEVTRSGIYCGLEFFYFDFFPKVRTIRKDGKVSKSYVDGLYKFNQIVSMEEADVVNNIKPKES